MNHQNKSLQSSVPAIAGLGGGNIAQTSKLTVSSGKKLLIFTLCPESLHFCLCIMQSGYTVKIPGQPILNPPRHVVVHPVRLFSVTERHLKHVQVVVAFLHASAEITHCIQYSFVFPMLLVLLFLSFQFRPAYIFVICVCIYGRAQSVCAFSFLVRNWKYYT